MTSWAKESAVKSDVAPPVIELLDVYKDYRVGTELVHALRGVSLTIRANEYVAIMGQSGSGKSTLMNILGCLDVLSKGVYRLRGHDVSKLSQSKLAHVRGRQIGFVFQSFELLGRTTALKNVELPLSYTRVRHRRQRALEALRRVNLLDRAHHRPNQLSGGQKQRVALARALAQQPDLILADEPTGNLDTTTGSEIMAVFDRLHEEGQTIVIVTHEDDIARHCRRVIKLRDGLVVVDTAVSPEPSALSHQPSAVSLQPEQGERSTTPLPLREGSGEGKDVGPPTGLHSRVRLASEAGDLPPETKAASP